MTEKEMQTMQALHAKRDRETQAEFEKAQRGVFTGATDNWHKLNTRIGTALVLDDGTINVTLEALPLNGLLSIRKDSKPAASPKVTPRQRKAKLAR